MISKEDVLLKTVIWKTEDLHEQPIYVGHGVPTTIGEGFYANLTVHY